MSGRVLLVDDDADVRDALTQTLELAGLEPEAVASVTVAKDRVRRAYEGVIVADIRMPGRDGFHLLSHVRGIDPELPVILLTGEGDVPMAVRGMAEGAFDFLEKPCASADLIGVVQKALATRKTVMDARRRARAVTEGDAAARWIFGVSDRAEAIRAEVRRVASAGAEVLLTGAPGSGLSKVAEVIHLLSGAAARPFLRVKAAGADEAAIDAAFAEAGEGTLFIDEVADLSPGAQFALLDRLGGQAKVRVIAGTVRDLAAEAEARRFNPDLYLELDVLRVHVPSLAERPEDIPAVFRAYVAQAAEQAGVEPPEIGAGVLTRLTEREWPGNARALMNEAMRFVLGTGGETDAEREGGAGLAERMAAYERHLLSDALTRAEGRATEAARALKLPRKTFYDKLARYDLRPEDFRA